jgi:N-acetylglucosaminyldiphosphoundecaprenol N-acetyl-beta-D-mannosaminyltransferase
MPAVDNYKVQILGIPYNNLFLKDVFEQLFMYLERKIKFTVLFLNADCLFKAQNDEEYKEILKKAEFVFPDGIGLRLAAKFLTSIRVKDNCNGTVLSPLLMKGAANKGYKIFFLGAKEGVAEKAAENIRKKMPGIRIAGTHHGYFKDDEEVIKKINASGADILFVAMGIPLQEKWIARNRASLNARLYLGVGALFDYLSGQIPRAPKFMQAVHLEWLWRTFIEPRRMFKRYIIDGVKLGRIVFKYKFGLQKRRRKNVCK